MAILVSVGKLALQFCQATLHVLVLFGKARDENQEYQDVRLIVHHRR